MHRGNKVVQMLNRPFCLVFSLLCLFLFFHGGVPGFRDGAHFYGPLFEFVFDEFRSGRFPLWNPYENLGQPLAANPTSLLFYPGTYLAFIPVFFDILNVDSAYAIFAAVHLLLAFLTAYRLARSWSCGRHAASLTALSYALSGSVLFQWNNVPFLIGAAWFPEALRQIGKIVERGKLRHAVFLSVVSSLMIFGGEPQSVYHAGIVAGLFLIVFFGKSTVRSIGLLSLSAVLTFFLAAVQILPAWELNCLSDRILPEHHATVYRFFVPVWRLLEFCWPGAGGWQLPVHARWFSAFRGENGIWVPSLYLGLMPFVLALLTVFQFRTKYDYRSKRLQYVVLTVLFLFLLGSFGKNFAVYPLFRLFPGYDAFRYPGKLMLVSSLMLSILAGWGFDSFFKDSIFRNRFAVFGRTVVVLGCFASTSLAWFFAAETTEIPACPLFGPFDSQGAISGLLFGSVCILACWIVFETKLKTGKSRTLLLLLVFADLCFANAWMLTASSEMKKNADQSPQFSLANEIRQKGSAPVRIYRFPIWYPDEFKKRSSRNRLSEIIDWEKGSLYPRYPLPKRINLVDVRGTLMLKDYRIWIDEIRQNIRSNRFENSISRLENLGVEYIIAPKNQVLPNGLIDTKTDGPADVSLWKLVNPDERNFVRYEPNRIVFDVSLKNPETVVLTEQYYPGWRAFVEKREISVRKTDPCFRAVELPPGRHRIEMIYDPPLVKVGGLMSLFGLLISVLILVSSLDPLSRQESRIPFGQLRFEANPRP